MTLPFADQVALIIPTADEPPSEEVRCWVQDTLAAVAPGPRLHAALVVDELVGNARAHGLPPYVLRVAVDPGRRALRVFVEDCAAHGGARWRTRGGLALVDGLSRRWGVERRTSAKTVWAEVGL